MAHKIDMDSLARTSFLLRHLTHGNVHVFRELQFTRKADAEISYGWGHHGLQLQMLVSELLIDAAIKLRIILDVLRDQDMEHPSEPDFESRFVGANTVGHFIPSGTRITLREACNKIIHARKVTLQWKNADAENYEYWDGTVILNGTKGSDDWQCLVSANEFSTVLESYVSEIKQTGDYYGTWVEA